MTIDARGEQAHHGMNKTKVNIVRDSQLVLLVTEWTDQRPFFDASGAICEYERWLKSEWEYLPTNLIRQYNSARWLLTEAEREIVAYREKEA